MPRSRGGGRGRSGQPAGGRALRVRLKTAKGRRSGSVRWLDRQLNDPYVQAAQAEGYRSRAAFKLKELDDRFGLIKPQSRVVDLGAAPGGWTQVAVERAGPDHVLAVDRAEMAPVQGAKHLRADMLEPGGAEKIRELLGGEADVVLSDMAASATGHRQTDHLRTMRLCETAFEIACDVLAEGGSFVAKVLRGGTEAALLARMKQRFREVRHVKPRASRAESAEIYVVATGFRADVTEEE